jgi:hypothetical protein
MLDEPTPEVIVATVAEALRQRILPLLTGAAAFEARLCINALELVGRQLAHEEPFARAEGARLERLLGHPGSLEDLNRELAARIRDGAMTRDNAGLVAHLWATVMEKLAVDQPTYAAYVREKTAQPEE